MVIDRLLDGVIYDLRHHNVDLMMQMEAIKRDESRRSELIDLWRRFKDLQLDIAYWVSQGNARATW